MSLLLGWNHSSSFYQLHFQMEWGWAHPSTLFSNPRTRSQNTFLKSQNMALMNEILCSIFTQSYRTRSSRPSSPVHTFKYFGDCALVDSGMGGIWNLQFALLLASLTFLALDGFFPWIFLPILGVTAATPPISSLQCLIKALHPSVRNSQKSVFYLTFFFWSHNFALLCSFTPLFGLPQG